MTLKPNYFILQGGPELIKYWLDPERYSKITWYWSANKHVRPGDKALIYLTAPLSRIVGVVDVLGEPFFNPQSNSAFLNPHMMERWCVEVGKPVYFGNREDLRMANLKKLFGSDWGWVRYPRGNTQVPDEILPTLLELVDSCHIVEFELTDHGKALFETNADRLTAEVKFQEPN